MRFGGEKYDRNQVKDAVKQHFGSNGKTVLLEPFGDWVKARLPQ